MIGLFAVISEQKMIQKEKYSSSDHFLSETYVVDNNLFSINTLNKFMNDKVVFGDENWIILFDGVLFNKEEIFDFVGISNFTDALIYAVQSGRLEEIVSLFRGSFVGIIYDIKEKRFYGFNDQWSTKPIFYSDMGKGIIVSSEVNEIVEFYRQNNIGYRLNMVGAYSLITNAYMYDDNTLIENIKRVPPGSVVTKYDGKLQIDRYHIWKFTKKSVDYNKSIEKLDELFLKAIDRQLKKNDEYEYKNIVPLSAGLDCRMVSFAAHRLGRKDIINYSYSESGQNDELIPARMARWLGNQWFYMNLDNGLDMKNIEESIDIADGLIYYPWVSQLNTFLRNMNTEKWGVVHTGVIGDVIIGSFCKSLRSVGEKYKIGDGAYSKKLVKKLADLAILGEMSYEEGMIYNRAINGACMGYSSSFRRYSESYSPFMDVDFAEFCFSLPSEFRVQHKIYYDWVLKKYPDAAKFPHNGVRISNAMMIKIGGKKFHIDTIGDLVVNKIKSRFSKKTGMNPMDFWYASNKDLKDCMDKYFSNNMVVMDKELVLKADLEKLYNMGNTIDKTLAISLVGSYKKFFGKDKMEN